MSSATRWQRSDMVLRGGGGGGRQTAPVAGRRDSTAERQALRAPPVVPRGRGCPLSRVDSDSQQLREGAGNETPMGALY